MVRAQKVSSLISCVLLTISSIVVLFPILWMVSVSFRRNVDIFQIPPAWIPAPLSTEAYGQIFGTASYARAFINSCFVAVVVTIVSLTLATLAAYAFSRFDFRGNRPIQLLVVGTQMVPPITLIVPYFILISTLRLYDTYAGLVLTYSAFVLPFGTLMMISYFNTIPQDLEEAAMVDGCGRFGALVRIVLPMLVPGLIATGVYSFLLAWNEFLFAVTLTQSDNMRLVTVAIAMLAGEHAYQWNVIMAMSTLTCFPVLVAYLFVQKYLISGLTLGAVKG